ncbi:TRAP transporter small permease [Rhodovulum sp. FJ3]|uniref:TRAP transporter small permease subunit n=1 Tax=Rhodovulum sp. FJ3 TaxID=3079053 RepID=UPI00293DAB5A|nr:TRAP transporter small permease [Rhodovulum sp. FJ3]MDV4168731.1 TRAP transporter small permease [Rhodovulum sp. FJ3]
MSLKSLHSRLHSVARMGAVLGGFGIIFISFMVTIDVFLRKFFSTTLGGATEIAGMVFGVATAIAYPFVLLERANIRIDVLYSRLSGRARAWLDLVAMVLVLYFTTRLTQSTFDLLQKSWTGGSRSVGVINTPLWVPQSLWVAGFILLTLTALFLTVYSVIGLIRRDWAVVNTVAGVPSIEHTIEEETHIDVPHADVDAAVSANKEDN